MGRYLPAIMIAVCSASCFGVEPVVTLPAEVSGDVGAFIRVEAETNGTVVQWFEDEPGLNLFPVDLLKDTRVAVVTASREGKYRLLAYTAIGDMPSRPAVVTIVVGKVPPKPVPVPDIDDDDPPTPDPPKPDVDPILPGNGFRVMILYESGDRLPAGQAAIITSAKLRDYIESKGGKDSYRIWDDDLTDANLANQPAEWRTGFANAKKAAKSVPWLIATNGSKQVSVALPADVDTTIQVLQGIE